MKTLLLILVLALGAFANAQDEKIESLIEGLASPNEPLNPKRQPFRIPIPPSYDLQAQERIGRTIDELKGHGKTAFPYLIKHHEDRRYCRSYAISILNDFTVGETCMEIIDAQIDSFDGRVGYLGMPQYSDSVIQRDPAGWWKQHSSMSVSGMRIEALKWTIKAEKEEMKPDGREFYKMLGMTRIAWGHKCLGPLLRLLEAEQAGAGQPVAKPADKVPAKDQPSIPAAKVAPRQPVAGP